MLATLQSRQKLWKVGGWTGAWLSRGWGLVASKAGGGQTYGMTGPDEIAVLRIELEDIKPLIWRARSGAHVN